MKSKNAKLIKKIDGEYVVINPQTKADNVLYNEQSTIKEKIDTIKEILNMPISSISLKDSSGNTLTDNDGLPLISI